MSRELPPCDHDECGPTHCKRVGKANDQGSLAAPSGSPKVVLVPMNYTDAVKMLADLVSDLPPHPFAHNIRHEQWDLMLPNLESMEAKILKAKRVLAAISENSD